MTYLALKWLHLIGASVLFGTGLGIAFFTWLAYRNALRSGNLALLQGVLVLTVLADTLFTAIAVVLQPVTGLALWSLGQTSWKSSWLVTVFVLYIAVGLCWVPVVVLQIRLRNAAHAANSIADLDARFHARFRLWFLLGWPAFLGVLLLFALMVARGRLM